MILFYLVIYKIKCNYVFKDLMCFNLFDSKPLTTLLLFLSISLPQLFSFLLTLSILINFYIINTLPSCFDVSSISFYLKNSSYSLFKLFIFIIYSSFSLCKFSKSLTRFSSYYFNLLNSSNSFSLIYNYFSCNSYYSCSNYSSSKQIVNS